MAQTTAHDVIRALTDAHEKLADRLDNKPTGVTPGYHSALGGTVLPNGKIRYVGTTTMMGALCFGKTTTSATSGVQTTMSVASPQFDTGGFYSAGTDNRLVAPISGYYFGIATISFATDSTGDRNACLAQIDTDGSDLGVIFVTQHAGAASGRATIIQTSGPYYLTAGQGFQMRGTQWSGGSINMTTASSLAMWLMR